MHNLNCWYFFYNFLRRIGVCSICHNICNISKYWSGDLQSRHILQGFVRLGILRTIILRTCLPQRIYYLGRRKILRRVSNVRPSACCIHDRVQDNKLEPLNLTKIFLIVAICLKLKMDCIRPFFEILPI